MTASTRIFYESRFTTCVYHSLWFLFDEALISPDQMNLIGVSIRESIKSSYSYLCSSYRMNDTIQEW